MDKRAKPGWLARLSAVQTKTWLALIIVVAVLLRVAVAVYLGDGVEEMPGTFDQISYDMLARQVLAGHGFTVAEDWWPVTPAGQPTAHWSYLYTLYLVAVYGLAGYHPLVARLVQAVLTGILMPWLVYRLGERIVNRRVGLLAAALMAGYAYFVYYAAALMTEMLYITAILGAFDLLIRLADRKSGPPPVLPWVWLGLSLGVAVLFRQLFMLLIPFLSGWLLWRGWKDARFWRTFWGLAISGIVVIAMIAPWTVRNYRAFNRLVLLNTNAGYAFFWGNHPIHGTNFISILPADGPSYQDLIPDDLMAAGLNEAELDQALLKRGLGFVRDDPVRYLLLSASRLKDYFKFWPSAQSSTISNLSRVLSFGILWPFMLYGLILSMFGKISAKMWLLYLFMLVYTGIHLLSWALIRYRLPVDAVLLVFAASAILDIFSRLRNRVRFLTFF